MAREITQRQRAEAIIDKVKAELPPIWLGGRQRMVLVDEIAKALTTTRQEALLECAKVARNRADLYKPKLGLWLNMVNYHRSQEADDLADTLDRLAQEGAPSIDLSTTIQDDSGYGEHF